jgi:soluble lytic murein transglycosylase-like protein
MRLSNRKWNLAAFPRTKMRLRHASPAAILLGIIGLCAMPAHAQIVSYLDSSGKRVFVNADPPTPARHGRPSLVKAAVGPNGELRTPQSQSEASAQDAAAIQANRDKIDKMVHEVAERYHVDPALIRAVVETESHWNPAAVSRRGALGLMQLVPETAHRMGVNDVFDPKQNLDGGVHYLRTLLERYNGDLDRALAAYNAGPGAVDRAGGIPRYRETRAYVQKVTDSYFRPGSDRLSSVFGSHPSIYRVVQADGRVVFTNE